MNEVYNLNKISQIAKNISFEDFNFSETDIINKVLYKKLKSLFNSINSIKLIYHLTENKNEFIKKYFPIKYADVSSRGSFFTKHFYYRASEGKIVWVVDHNGEERIFKIKTEDWRTRISDEINQILSKVRKQLDSVYGYYIEGSLDDYFITDKNFINGKYKVICSKHNYKDNKFISYNEWETNKFYIKA